MNALNNTRELQYNRPIVSNTRPTSVSERVEFVSMVNGLLTLDYYFGLDPDAVAEVNSVTVTAGSAGDVYVLRINDDVETERHVAAYVAQTGDTATRIASRLAAAANLSPVAKATASGNTITITSEKPGRNMAVDNTGSDTPGNLTVAVTTPAAGTFLERRAMRAELRSAVTSGVNPEGNGAMSLEGKVTHYDVNGTTVLNPTAQFQRIGTLGTRTLDAFQLSVGIERDA